MLYYDMLFYVMLCYDMLCYVMICYVILCYVKLCHDMLLLLLSIDAHVLLRVIVTIRIAAIDFGSVMIVVIVVL
jgi:hypothetical protein